MSLLYDSMVPCKLMVKTRVPDGVGGFTTTYAEGASFQAAIVFDSSVEAKVAQAQGVTSVYKLTCPSTAELDYHEVIKRVSDGKIFRVTSDSDDMKTPAAASFAVRCYDCEEWELPS